MGNGRSVGVEDVPESAVVVQALTGGHPRSGVAGEVVQGVAAVGDLLLAVGSARCPESVGGQAGADLTTVH